MASVLVLAPDPTEAEALVQGFIRRRIPHEDVRIGTLDCVLLPALDVLIAVGGNGKAQYGIQAQYVIDRCDGIELLVCVGAAGRLSDALQIGDVVLGTATVEHDYKERFQPTAVAAVRGQSWHSERIHPTDGIDDISIQRALRRDRERRRRYR